jgi:hypothetical protein
VTTNIEKAASLCKGVSEGRTFAPEQLALEVGVLLDCLERLDKRKQHKKALRLARALATLLMLLKRWSDLLRTLRIALEAGKALGDLEAVAWARHELGSLRLVAGDLQGADRDLREAGEIRERIGDRRGLAATERNLRILCDRLRQMVQDEELIRRSASRRPSALRMLALAAIFALLFGAGGFGAGYVAGDGGAQNQSAAEDQRNGDGKGPTGDNDQDHLLFVTLAGEGGGTVTGAGLECGESSCEAVVEAGEDVTLVADAAEGWIFASFSSGPCEGTDPCELTMSSPVWLVATFAPDIESSGPTGDGRLQDPEEESQTAKEQAADELAERERTAEEQAEQTRTAEEAKEGGESTPTSPTTP